MFRVARLSVLARCYSTLSDQIPQIIKKDKVVVFMKGVPEQPRCGFSNAVVQILKTHGVTFNAYDVLADEDLRQGIKDFSNWPTIPQVFINGDFVGGCDILFEMHKSGELVTALKDAGIESALKEEPSKSSKE